MSAEARMAPGQLEEWSCHLVRWARFWSCQFRSNVRNLI